MTEEQVRRAVREAERFLDAARTALATRERYTTDTGKKIDHMAAGKTAAAAKRASLDLSRALSEMRGRR